MGYLYVKVIESKKVAVRNSFFVNYPFVRVVIGKEKKSTNFKPGVEWWDKIMRFAISKGEHQQIIVQARDKSIHVFGSDWLGEVIVDLDTEGYLDGRVHQSWFKFGRGRKSHSRSPRGYVHLAFQYFDQQLVVDKRPFSLAPVEEVVTFEEWLAKNNKNWTSDSSQWFSSSTNSIADPPKKPSSRLLKSDNDHPNTISPDEPRKQPKTTDSINEINPDSQSDMNTRPRSKTLPNDVRSPNAHRDNRERHAHFADASSSDDDADSETDEPRTGTLIDLSFDAPSQQAHGRSTHLRDRTKSATVASFQPTTTSIDPKAFSIDDHIENIKRLSLSQSTNNAPVVVAEEPKINNQPSFTEWYHAADPAAPAFNPKNPFISMHDNFTPPAYSVN